MRVHYFDLGILCKFPAVSARSLTPRRIKVVLSLSRISPLVTLAPYIRMRGLVCHPPGLTTCLSVRAWDLVVVSLVLASHSLVYLASFQKIPSILAATVDTLVESRWCSRCHGSPRLLHPCSYNSMRGLVCHPVALTTCLSVRTWPLADVFRSRVFLILTLQNQVSWLLSMTRSSNQGTDVVVTDLPSYYTCFPLTERGDVGPTALVLTWPATREAWR
jgi:hypothetical protein